VGASRDTFLATRTSTALPFGNIQAISELATASDEGNPSLTADELTIVFEPDRPGSAGIDIYTASRADMASPFSNVSRLPGESTDLDERSPAISSDGATVRRLTERRQYCGPGSTATTPRSSLSCVQHVVRR